MLLMLLPLLIIVQCSISHSLCVCNVLLWIACVFTRSILLHHLTEAELHLSGGTRAPPQREENSLMRRPHPSHDEMVMLGSTPSLPALVTLQPHTPTPKSE